MTAYGLNANLRLKKERITLLIRSYNPKKVIKFESIEELAQSIDYAQIIQTNMMIITKYNSKLLFNYTETNFSLKEQTSK